MVATLGSLGSAPSPAPSPGFFCPMETMVYALFLCRSQAHNIEISLVAGYQCCIIV